MSNVTELGYLGFRVSDGEAWRRFATEVVGDNLIMLDKRGDGPGHGSGESLDFGGDEIPPPADPGETLPF